MSSSLTAIVRRVRRTVRTAVRRRRGGLPDLDATRRQLELDPSPAPDGTAIEWWLRETSRLGAHPSPPPTGVAPQQSDGGIPRGMVDADVAIVCATNRPANVDEMIINIARQSIVDRIHAVIVLNAGGFDAHDIERRLHDAGCAAVTVLHVSADQSLGVCLRTGITATRARYIAKFDDDDTYGTRHVERSVEVLMWSGAAVTGKHTYLMYLADIDETALRFPGREWNAVGFVAGGTIVFDRERIGLAEFGDSNVGEDSTFLSAVERKGGLIVSNTALGYVQYRGASNTWRATTSQLLEGGSPVGRGDIRAAVAAN